jgi:hypothetical protein
MADDADKDIQKKTDGFISGMNGELESMKKDLEKKNKGAKGAAKIPEITLVQDKNKATYARTPEEHVKELLENDSWTFTSRHMNNAARHVLVKVDGKITFAINKAKGWEPYDFEEVKKAWVAQMKKQDLRNYKDKLDWGTGDELHLQLPDSEPSLSDPNVKKVIELYLTATRKDGKKKNDTLETDFKKVIEEYEKKLNLTPAAAAN